LGFNSWLLCGDFNFVRKRKETTCTFYTYKVSARFNQFISDEQLFELFLSDRQFTWSKLVTSNNMALLDRFFCSLDWNNHFNTTVVKSLLRFLLDHNTIVLSCNMSNLQISKPI
jgi:hypothetical protein